MREWRVGTLSMGLLLVASGIGLLYGQFNQVGVAQLAFKWWPLIFVVLGIEVLVQYYFRSSSQSKINYDIFSIFIILIIVTAGVVIQTAAQFGVTDYVQREIRSDNYDLTSPTSRIDASKAKNIVIHAEDGCRLIVRDSASQKVSIYERGHVKAETRQEALRILKDNVKVSSRLEGDTLYIDLDGNMYPNNYYVTLPAQAAVELERSGTQVEISPSAATHDWVLKGDGYTRASIPSGASLLVSTMDTDIESIHGNIAWTSWDGKTLFDLLKAEQALQAQGQSGNQAPELQAKIGKGEHKLTIIGSSEITVNVLP